METTPILFKKDFVEELLPQKFPFVMVDKIYAFSATHLISGLEIQKDNLFFNQDYFLESGLIEHMAQSVALHSGCHFYMKKEVARPIGYIGAIKDIVIKKLPQLHDEIKTTVTILQEFDGITLVDVVTFLNGIEIASGQMKTVLAK